MFYEPGPEYFIYWKKKSEQVIMRKILVEIGKVISYIMQEVKERF